MMSIFGAGFCGCSQTGGIETLLCAGLVCWIKSLSAASELMMVTLKRFPIRPSTAVPKRICVWSFT